ncbi:MAG: PepSY domain-containing protein [Peptococcaceae bacterium]|nr:PepSY domain-containing protein [Peptococcaceae bacterium]
MRKLFPKLFIFTSILVLLTATVALATQNKKMGGVFRGFLENPPEFKSENASIEKGIVAIKNFSGKADIDLKYLKTDKYPQGMVMQFTSSDNVHYSVNESGKVVMMQHLGLPVTGNIVINADNAFEIAKKYAQEKYTNFTSRNMKLIKNGIEDLGSHKQYFYLWREEVNGILTPNYLQVTVNPYVGKVSMYGCLDVTLPNVNAPKITRDQAINIVRQDYPDVRNPIAELDMWLSENGEPLIRWTVRAERPNRDDGTARGVHIVINAVTGQIISRAGY